MTDFDLAAIATPSSQGPERLVVSRTEKSRIVPVLRRAPLQVVPRIGHLHVTIDRAAWPWVDTCSTGIPSRLKRLQRRPR
jgi:hypothetical protein